MILFLAHRVLYMKHYRTTFVTVESVGSDYCSNTSVLTVLSLMLYCTLVPVAGTFALRTRSYVLNK